MIVCAVCGSPDWFAVAPGTDASASRFVSDSVSEIAPTDAIPTRAYCLSHWRQSWVPAPPKPVEDEDEAIGQGDLFVMDRIETARAAVAADMSAEMAESIA